VLAELFFLNLALALAFGIRDIKHKIRIAAQAAQASVIRFNCFLLNK